VAGANVSSLNLTSAGSISDTGVISAGSLNTSSNGGAILDAGHFVSRFKATNSGSGNIVFNNNGTMAVDASNPVGDVTIDNKGDVLLGLISAPGQTVSVTADGSDADILNNNGANTNVESYIVNLTAGWHIGESASEPITLDIDATGQIVLKFGAPEAYIVNLNQTPVTVTAGGLVLDIIGTAIAGVGKALDADLAEVGFIDWSLFSEDLSLFGVVEPGIKLPADQVEDEFVFIMPEPDVPLLIKTADSWGFLQTFRSNELGRPFQLKLQNPSISF
jgi:hypothetical protein